MEAWTQWVTCKVTKCKAMGHVNFARDPLRSYFMNLRKIKFISYTCIYIILGMFSIN